MDKHALAAAVDAVHADWLALVDGLASDDLDRPVGGGWRVRDVLAHANCWDRWQLVQLRSAFSGETPTDAELHGPITFPPNDDMGEDAMNAMFLAGYADWPTTAVVDHFREVLAMRAAYVDGASQDELDAIVGGDWTGGTNRVMRRQTEVPGVTDPRPASHLVEAQVDHLRGHFEEVRAALT